MFCDESSLETSREESKIREFWYLVMFESKFKEIDEEVEVVLLDEMWVVCKVVEG